MTKQAITELRAEYAAELARLAEAHRRRILRGEFHGWAWSVQNRPGWRPGDPPNLDHDHARIDRLRGLMEGHRWVRSLERAKLVFALSPSAAMVVSEYGGEPPPYRGRDSGQECGDYFRALASICLALDVLATAFGLERMPNVYALFGKDADDPEAAGPDPIGRQTGYPGFLDPEIDGEPQMPPYEGHRRAS